MRTRLWILASLLLMGAETACMAQSAEKSEKAIQKEKVKKDKLTLQAIEAKATKKARQEAKRLTKEGWKPAPGKMPLDAQLDKVYRKQYETTENGNPKYLVGTADVTGNDYTEAQKKAKEFARQDLIEQLTSETKELLETNLNSVDTGSDGQSMNEFVAKAATDVGAKLYRLPVELEAYRDVNGKKEVMLMVACPTNQIMKTLLESITDTKSKLYLQSILNEW